MAAAPADDRRTTGFPIRRWTSLDVRSTSAVVAISDCERKFCLLADCRLLLCGVLCVEVVVVVVE
eukprot:3934164-Prymnesium_polylepis.1